MEGRWVNTSGLDSESFHRLCRIADYLSYSPDKGAFASITMLNNPARIVYLQKRYRHELYEDPSDVVWRIIGSAVHDVMYRGLGFGELDREKVKFADEILLYVEKIRKDNGVDTIDPMIIYSQAFQKILERVDTYKEIVSKMDSSFLQRYISEERLSAEVCGVNISGTNDIYDTVDKKIVDYKTTGVDKILLGSTEEWEQQLNGYAFLRRCHGFIVESLEVNALLRDWMRRKAKYERGYPKHSLLVIPIRLWSYDTQKAFFEEKVRYLLKYQDMSDEDLPICSPSDRWEKPPKVAVVEVEKFIITNDVIRKIQEILQPLDSISKLRLLEGTEYFRRDALYSTVRDTCGDSFCQQYVEDIFTHSAVRKYDASGRKLKRAMRVVDSIKEAVQWVDWKGTTQTWALEHRVAEPIRCIGNYCGVNEYCSFWKDYESLS